MYLGTIKNGKFQTYDVHFSIGILNRERYHRRAIGRWSRFDGVIAQRVIAFHEMMIENQGIPNESDPRFRTGTNYEVFDSETESSWRRCWRMETDDEIDRWFRMVNPLDLGITPEDCFIILNFDKKIAIIKEGNGIIDWQEYLPEGWTVDMV